MVALCLRNASVRPTLPGGPSSERDCITLSRAGHPAPCAPTPYPGSTLHEPGAGVARWPRRRLAACRREADVGEEDTDFRRQSVSAHAHTCIITKKTRTTLDLQVSNPVNHPVAEHYVVVIFQLVPIGTLNAACLATGWARDQLPSTRDSFFIQL